MDIITAGQFDWGTVTIHRNAYAIVNRTNGHMDKAQVAEALKSHGFKIASKGRPVPNPIYKARAYDIKAA
jgi:hypothetical protein